MVSRELLILWMNIPIVFLVLSGQEIKFARFCSDRSREARCSEN